MTGLKDASKKHDRMLEIYSRLLSGKTICKRALADEYGINPRSIQRGPVGLMGAEYYFYLIAHIGDKDKEHPGYSTVYRVDRITKYCILDKISRSL